jgi:hypothetical protein
VRRVDFWLYSKVSEKYTAYIFRTENGGSIFLRKPEDSHVTKYFTRFAGCVYSGIFHFLEE